MAAAAPSVSVIVPAYNSGRFLAEALRSILAQADTPLEVIVVDDGSTDDTAQVAAGFGGALTYVHQPNQGVAAARNHGLRLARGEVLAFLDADDRWPEGKLACQLAALAQPAAPPLVMGHLQFLRELPGGEYVLEPAQTQGMLMGCLVARRAAFDQVGAFDTRLHMSEDTDWFIRARECGLPLTMLPDTVLYYRRHNHSLTSGKTAQDLPLALVLKRSLDRRRQQGQA